MANIPTQNAHLSKERLRHDWGFQGVVMSDWTATYDGLAAANGGLDLEMPFAKLMTPETLKAGLASGKLSMAVLDEKCRRILGTAIQFGWLDREQTISSIPLNNPNADKVALEESLESITLLKNEGGLLPLDPKRVKTSLSLDPKLPSLWSAAVEVRTIPLPRGQLVAGSYAGGRQSLQGDVCSRPSTPRNHLWPHLVPQPHRRCKRQGRTAAYGKYRSRFEPDQYVERRRRRWRPAWRRSHDLRLQRRVPSHSVRGSMF